MTSREISERAAQLAKDNPPLVVLENAFFGLFTLIGLVFGTLWFFGSKLVFIIGLAFLDGYKKGARAGARTKEDAPKIQPVAPPILEDNRIRDAYETPFGVPFGPNVMASHE